MHIEQVNDSPKILITGANGFTGRHACTYFAEAGFTVFALVRKSGPPPHPSIQLVHGDLMDHASLQLICATIQPDYILHLAGQNAVGSSWTHPIETLEANLFGTSYLLEAVRTEAPRSKVLVVGSVLKSDPANLQSFIHPYGLSKTLQTLFAQVYASLFQLDVIIANPSNLIGPGNSSGVCTILAEKIAQMEAGLAEPKLSVYNLLASRDFLDVRDAVAAYHVLFEKGTSRQEYTVSSGNSVTMQEVTTLLKQLSDVPFEVEGEIEQDEISHSLPPDELRGLGWKPAISIKESLADILDFHRKKTGK